MYMSGLFSRVAVEKDIPDGKGALIEAFSNWKSIYNMSMCMTYGKLHNFELIFELTE